MPRHLTIPQALFLLALDDESGRPKGNYNNYIQAGGALAELILHETITVQTGRKAYIEIAGSAPTDSPFLAAVYDRIAASKKPITLQRWVSKISCIKGRKHLLGHEVERMGAVRESSQRILGLFPVTRWPQMSPALKQALLDDMSNLMFDPVSEINPHTASIVALANAGHLLKRNFDRNELRASKARITAIKKGDWPAAEATRKTIAAINAAIAAAASTSALAASG